MIRLYPNEQVKEFKVHESLKFRYAITSHGRLISFKETITNGRLLNGGLLDGYRIFRYKVTMDTKIANKHHFFYKLIAEAFLPKTSEDQQYVLHLDYVRDNDTLRNLKWATREEMLEHGKKSPHVIQAKKDLLAFNHKSDGKKLTITKVMLIKKLLQNPDRKTRLKMIAKQFGVSEMQIRRIQSGENWGYVKI
ncbi:hypothetical protein [Flavobacterium restrictum]|uniref:NUMOD4 domain-containing protein n=1 Tax=Flavobacterium restrictum TaxID=2594428 RepID=A0A553E3E2_9FLAO|nr:hypothetical protein [Flavobacterium restrictum]TRX39490.1 hypothetical protein FNW21_09365 [Flavobacterium restrictum]